MNTCLRFGREDFDIGVPVFRWMDAGGFDGYTRAKTTVIRRGEERVKRGPRISAGPRRMQDISQFVVHHSGGDGKDPSTMYDVLWFQRFLSVQFALEDDGRIYQFLDPTAIAWHAGRANRRSVGVECCLYPDAGARPNYYSEKNCERRGNLPHEVEEQKLQGMNKKVFMMPDVQVESLARLIAAVWLKTGRDMPPMFPRVPKNGGPIPYEFVDGSLEYEGIVGHFHLTKKKWDPAGLHLATLEERVAQHFLAWKAEE